ncbi:MAG: FAD-dependent 5-carboxymethylaminomethyl-2-thiouridine(34) oxidoreductase MnmC [Neisseriaceae bacterium]|nr:MAG: FAD-dependent 5-carboxymethylaminomethyl-2-thiouridine(34) oxidoreductase MnmC [Neisseriaceae bacterium]
MGVNSLISDYVSKIDLWIKKLSSQDIVIFLWQGFPDVSLIQYVQNNYPKRVCYWLIFSEWSLVIDKKKEWIQSYPHLNDFEQVLNPIGMSVFTLEPHTYLWINLSNDIEKFLYDFEYDASLICYLNIPEIQPIVLPNIKPWYQPIDYSKRINVKQAVIVGGGIAGATTAYFLAQHDVQVTLLEKEKDIASKASGNYQGVLYAKVSPHHTIQTELLYKSYGLSVSLLELMDSEHLFSDNCGVLHLNYDDRERERNLQLAEKNYHLNYYLHRKDAEEIAGIKIEQDGLFWPRGAWTHPRSWIQRLLIHPNIQVKTNFNVLSFCYEEKNSQWKVISANESIVSDALVLALGADDNDIYKNLGLNLSFISGQTSIIEANNISKELKIVLSGDGYIAPAYKNIHCFGSTFHPNNKQFELSKEDELMNVKNLYQLNHYLHSSFIRNDSVNKKIGMKGHHAVRCDSFDHLPVVGSLGDICQMRKVYAKLCLDKNYYLKDPCPYWPNLYINTAHGSRGLLTSSLCSLALVSEILVLPNPLGLRLRQSLSPNRLIINDIIKRRRFN